MSSIVRYNRAHKLLQRSLGKATVETIGKVFADHVGCPDGICRHPNPQHAEGHRLQTNLSGVLDLTHRRAWVCKGKPCSGSYLPYALGT